jgi:hypothetical protein
MRTGGLICAVCVLFLSCKGKDHVPADVLPKDKMEAVLWDIMRADQFLTDFVLNKDTSLNKETESTKFYQQVFTIHKISKEDFQRSFAFYRSHPTMLKDLMDSVGHRPVNPRNPEDPPPTTSPRDTIRKKFTGPTKMD